MTARFCGLKEMLRLICSGEDHAAFGSRAALDALAFFRRRISRDVANRRLGLVLDLLLTLARTTPVRPQEATFAVEDLVELRVIIHPITVLLAELTGPLEHRALNR